MTSRFTRFLAKKYLRFRDRTDALSEEGEAILRIDRRVDAILRMLGEGNVDTELNAVHPPGASSGTTSLRDFVKGLALDDAPKNFDADAIGADMQGWGSQSPLFAQVIDKIKPREIIEVGTWKGASAIHMAKLARAHHPDAAVLCIDTWLGSMQHWDFDDVRRDLDREHGFPRVYHHFLANVVTSGLKDHVFGLPLSSLTAAELLIKRGARADLIYIDAGHAEREVFMDIDAFWPVLRSGGTMIGDDFSWPEVQRAVHRFARLQKLEVMSFRQKWQLQKA
jgi:predicted O-methyltransferase YrrM